MHFREPDASVYGELSCAEGGRVGDDGWGEMSGLATLQMGVSGLAPVAAHAGPSGKRSEERASAVEAGDRDKVKEIVEDMVRMEARHRRHTQNQLRAVGQV